jgi:hypothetical protein
MSKTGGLSPLADVSGEYWHEENYFAIYNVEPRDFSRPPQLRLFPVSFVRIL